MSALVCELWCAGADVVRCQACSSLDPASQAVTDAIEFASDVLFLLSGRQFPGRCTETVRPNRVEWYGSRWIGSVSVTTGEAFGIDPSTDLARDYASDRNLGAGAVSEIRLPSLPIDSITEVRVDGVVVPPSAYRINDDRWLLRIDGGFWPVVQDLTKDPLTDRGTFQVVYKSGHAIPSMARLAAADYACQVALALSGSASCELPVNTRSMIRQGLQVQVDSDALPYLQDGKVGVRTADDFLQATNPHQLEERAVVLSPDVNWPAHRLR